MSIVSSIVLLTFVSAAVEPRLSTVENQLARYGYKDFKQLEREEPTPESDGDAKPTQYTVWVNEESIDGMAVAIVDGDRRSGKVRAYFEVHNVDTRAWDALVTCYEDPRCRRTRVVKNGLRDRRPYSVGGPADMFYGALAPRELGIPSRFGVSEPSIRRAQLLGLHLSRVMRLFKRGLRGPSDQWGFKYRDEALEIVVSQMQCAGSRRVGKAHVRLWLGRNSACVFATMEQGLDLNALREHVASWDESVSQRLEAFLTPVEEENELPAEPAEDQAEVDPEAIEDTEGRKGAGRSAVRDRRGAVGARSQ